MRFRGDYWFLSNMCPAPMRVTLRGKEYRFTCLEAAFQACKCPEQASEFQGIDGFAAKDLGKKVPLRPDWDGLKIPLMERLVRIKFGQNPDLKAKLLATGNTPLVEDNTWGDTFWGTCNGQGRNNLGRILQAAREEYQLQTQAQTQTAGPSPQRTGRPLAVCFTGPRPRNMVPPGANAYDKRMYAALFGGLVAYVDQLHQRGYRTFITGGAQGFDQLAFWAVNSVKAARPDIKNELYVPMHGQESVWRDPAGTFGANEYRLMLEKADDVVYCEDLNGLARYDNGGRNAAMKLDARNRAMVDDADLCVALFKDPAGIRANLPKGSGTKNCMVYANKTGVLVSQILYTNAPDGSVVPLPDIIQIRPESVKVRTAETMVDRARKLVTGKPAETGAPAGPRRDTSDLDAAARDVGVPEGFLEYEPPDMYG